MKLKDIEKWLRGVLVERPQPTELVGSDGDAELQITFAGGFAINVSPQKVVICGYDYDNGVGYFANITPTSVKLEKDPSNGEPSSVESDSEYPSLTDLLPQIQELRVHYLTRGSSAQSVLGWFTSNVQYALQHEPKSVSADGSAAVIFDGMYADLNCDGRSVSIATTPDNGYQLSVDMLMGSATVELRAFNTLGPNAVEGVIVFCGEHELATLAGPLIDYIRKHHPDFEPEESRKPPRVEVKIVRAN